MTAATSQGAFRPAKGGSEGGSHRHVGRRPVGSDGRKLLLYVHAFWKENGRGPGWRPMWAALGIPRPRAVRKMKRLRRYGYLKWNDKPGSLHTTAKGLRAATTGFHGSPPELKNVLVAHDSLALAPTQTPGRPKSRETSTVAKSGNNSRDPREVTDAMATKMTPAELRQRFLAAAGEIPGATVQADPGKEVRVKVGWRKLAFYDPAAKRFRLGIPGQDAILVATPRELAAAVSAVKKRAELLSKAKAAA